jgi:hypothetical protein
MAIMTTLADYIAEPSAQFSSDGGFTPPADPQGRQQDIECLCPFCGSFNAGPGKLCSNCQTEDNNTARAAMRQRVGPWFVLNANNPAAPGMDFEQLQSLIRQDLVTSRSVVRGPGTNHLWRLASKVRGLSREFGLCYSCGGEIDTAETSCPHCDRSQILPRETAAEPTPAAPKPVTARIEILEPPAPTPKPSQPSVHVHTLSEGTGKDEFEGLLRPVIAEQCGRHIPKDDLLTPRDVAKAFQLEFDMITDQSNRLFDSDAFARKLKVGFISAVSLGAVIAIIWPMIHVIPDWLPLPAPASASASMPGADTSAPAPIASTLIADARPAADQIPAYRPARITEPAHVSEAHPVPSGDPIIVADPTPSASPADDPTALWNTGLDAESAGNYAKAVETYERIESLPSYQWPTHLEVRLELARKELKGEVRP